MTSPVRPLSLALFACLVVLLAVSGVGASTALPNDTSSASARTASALGITQSGKLFMHPQIAQPGRSLKNAKKAASSMSAVFRPARPGRTVVLQRQKGSRWVTVRRGAQNGRGIAEFTAPYKINGKIQTYRAFAVRHLGMAKVVTNDARTNKWGGSDFTDQFSGKTLGAAWRHRIQGYSAKSLRRCSRANPRAVSLGGGAVRISAINDPLRPTLSDTLNGTEKCRYEGKRYAWRMNGSIGTQGQKAFRYGYAAARVRFQPRRGQHAAFWLQPESRAALEGSAKKTGAEIDVIEWFGKGHPQGGLTSFIHYYPNDGKSGVTAKKVGGFIDSPGRFGRNWWGRYHVFSVEWTPERYVFRIDGKETLRISQGVSGRRQFLILSLLSSDYELKYLGGDDNLPQTMRVDWVRYWKR